MNVGKIPIKNEYFIAYIVVSYEMNKKKHFFFFLFYDGKFYELMLKQFV